MQTSTSPAAIQAPIPIPITYHTQTKRIPLLFFTYTPPLTSSNKHITSNSIHPLRTQLHHNLQQLPRNLAILLLQPLPRLRRQQPRNAIQLRHHTARPLRAAEKRQLAARRARHYALVVVALLEEVLCAQDAGLQQVKAVGRVAAGVEGLAAGESAAGEVGEDAEPEVFGARCEVLEGLEEEGQGLLEVAPPSSLLTL